MTIYQIECFLAVAEELDFTRAAEKLCLTQPAISYQISSMEKELGSKLFERTTRSCRLTSAGMAFAQDMKHMLVLYRQSVQRVHDIDTLHKSTLTIGIRKLFDYANMTRMVMTFQEKYPNTIVHILPHNDSAPLEDLRSGRIDVGFCFSCEHTEVSDIAFSPLYTMNYYALMNPAHPLARRRKLYMEDFRGVRIITGDSGGAFLSACAGNVLEDLQRVGADLTISVPSYEGAMIEIQKNTGLCVVPMLKNAQVPGMVKLPIMDCESVNIEICRLRRESRYTVSSFVNIAKAHYEVTTNLQGI